jgi:uncharacterized protein (DUF1800 family)
VFTGWNLVQTGTRGTPSAYYAFNYNAAQHDTNAKDFSFPIYATAASDPARARAGMQDGVDLTTLGGHPETAPPGRRLWTWFVSDLPGPRFVENIAGDSKRTTCGRRPRASSRPSSRIPAGTSRLN